MSMFDSTTQELNNWSKGKSISSIIHKNQQPLNNVNFETYRGGLQLFNNDQKGTTIV